MEKNLVDGTTASVVKSRQDATPHLMNEALRFAGVCQGLQAANRILDIVALVQIKNFKDAGLYKILPFPANPKQACTLKHFAEHYLGVPESSLRERLGFLEKCGQDLLQVLDKAGMSRDAMRVVARLPEGVRPQIKDGHLLLPDQDPIPVGDGERIAEGITFCIEAVQAVGEKRLAEEQKDHVTAKREVRAAGRRAEGYHALLKRFGIDPEADPPPIVERIGHFGGQAQLACGGILEAIGESKEADLGPQAIAEIEKVVTLIAETCANVRRALNIG